MAQYLKVITFQSIPVSTYLLETARTGNVSRLPTGNRKPVCLTSSILPAWKGELFQLYPASMTRYMVTLARYVVSITSGSRYWLV